MKLFAARLISFIAYPYFLVIVTTFIVLLKNTNLPTALFWTFIVGLFTVIILIFELFGLKIGMFSNFDISKRKQRTPFFLFVLLTLAAFVATVFVLHAPMIILQGAVGTFIAVSILTVVNRRVKASIHLALVSALLLTVAFLYGSLFYFALILIPVVAWSRVETKKHTIPETVYGTILGLSFTILGYLVVNLINQL